VYYNTYLRACFSKLTNLLCNFESGRQARIMAPHRYRSISFRQTFILLSSVCLILLSIVLLIIISKKGTSILFPNVPLQTITLTVTIFSTVVSGIIATIINLGIFAIFSQSRWNAHIEGEVKLSLLSKCYNSFGIFNFLYALWLPGYFVKGTALLCIFSYFCAILIHPVLVSVVSPSVSYFQEISTNTTFGSLNYSNFNVQYDILSKIYGSSPIYFFIKAQALTASSILKGEGRFATGDDYIYQNPTGNQINTTVNEMYTINGIRAITSCTALKNSDVDEQVIGSYVYYTPFGSQSKIGYSGLPTNGLLAGNLGVYSYSQLDATGWLGANDMSLLVISTNKSGVAHSDIAFTMNYAAVAGVRCNIKTTMVNSNCRFNGVSMDMCSVLNEWNPSNSNELVTSNFVSSGAFSIAQLDLNTTHPWWFNGARLTTAVLQNFSIITDNGGVDISVMPNYQDFLDTVALYTVEAANNLWSGYYGSENIGGIGETLINGIIIRPEIVYVILSVSLIILIGSISYIIFIPRKLGYSVVRECDPVMAMIATGSPIFDGMDLYDKDLKDVMKVIRDHENIQIDNLNLKTETNTNDLSNI
jgi:hypothetical protein